MWCFTNTYPLFSCDKFWWYDLSEAKKKDIFRLYLKILHRHSSRLFFLSVIIIIRALFCCLWDSYIIQTADKWMFICTDVLKMQHCYCYGNSNRGISFQNATIYDNFYKKIAEPSDFIEHFTISFCWHTVAVPFHLIMIIHVCIYLTEQDINKCLWYDLPEAKDALEEWTLQSVFDSDCSSTL